MQTELPSGLQVEAITPALHMRVLGLRAQSDDRIWRYTFLRSGSGFLQIGEEQQEFEAPCILWHPVTPGEKFTIHAGTEGFQLTITDQILANAIGHNPESVDLRYFLDHRLYTEIDDTSQAYDHLEFAFDIIMRETRAPQAGGWTMVQAQMRTALVLLWRQAGDLTTDISTHGHSSRILLTFRQLVETRFRDRWTIARYAAEIGISADRLHDICQRELVKSPNRLVQERVLHEARNRLARSTLSIDQIAASLGFRDVGYFNRFFKQKTGIPPGKFRKSLNTAQTGKDDLITASYADWP